jgi:ATP-dependent DNA helicase RecG
MMPAQIKKLIREGKSESVELGISPMQFDRVGITVCAFLNGNGGTIFLGATDTGKILSIDNPQLIVDKLTSYLLEHISPKALWSISIDIDENEKSIVTIEVQAGKDRPYLFNSSVYVRQGTQTRKADQITIQQIIQKQAVGADRWERRPSVNFEEDDLDRDEIAQTVKESQEAKRFEFPHPENIIDDLERLAVCRTGMFTQAADVLFAKNPALRHPQTRVRATCFSTDKGGDYIDNQTFQGPLVSVLKKVMDFISRNTPVSSRFEQGNLARHDRTAYPFDAVREGLVNAFAHRDYAHFSGGIAIGIHPNRLEIWNSGRLPEGWKPADLKKNHPSYPPNPDIAHVLYIRGFMERVGRGTQKIIDACKEYGLAAPKWQDAPSGVTLTLFSDKIGDVVEAALNERQNALMQALELGAEIKLAEYRHQFAGEVSERQARRDLKELVEMAFLTSLGAGARARYKRTNRTYNLHNRT